MATIKRRLAVLGFSLITLPLAAKAVPLTSGLEKYLPFDGNLSNWGNTTGSATVFSGVARYTTTGKLGRAAQFLNNGANTAPSDWAASLGNLNAIYTNDFTLALWIRTASNVDAGILGNKNWSSGSNVGWVVTTISTKNLNWNTSGGVRRDVPLRDVSGASLVSNGAWHSLVMTFSRSTNTVTTYLDGVAKNSQTLGTLGTESLNPSQAYNTLVGSSGPGTWGATGDVDDLAIWSRALTAAEAAQIYTLGQQGTSLAVQQTLDALPPTLTATMQSRRAVLKWTRSQAGLGTVTYQIFRDSVQVGTTTNLTYTDLNLTPSTSYLYRVDAVAGGKTLSSNPVTVTTAANTAPRFWGIGGHYAVAQGALAGTIIGEIRAVDSNIDDKLSYSLVGNANGFAINATTGVLTVITPPSTTGQLGLTVAVNDGITTVQRQFTVLVVPANQLTRQGVTRHLWNGIGGSLVSDLTTSTRYPNNFSSKDTLLTLTSPVNIADSYGQRLSGYLTVPTSGQYTFWIASDDASELRLAANTNPATLSSAPLASVTGWTNVNAWTANASQKSVAVNLVKGQYYYIEVLHKEGGGGDHVEVAWQGPGMTGPVAIPNANLLLSDALDSVAPSAPQLALLKVTASGVTLNWTSVQDNSGIANYLVYRDGTLIATLASNLNSFTDAGITGIHDYSVVAVDGFGNQSAVAALKGVDSSQTFDAVEQAIVNGSATALVEPTPLIDAALTSINSKQTTGLANLTAFYGAGTPISYTPGNNSQWPVPNADNEQIIPLLSGNKGKVLAIAGMAQGAPTTRFAAFGSIPTASFQAGGNAAYVEPFKRVLAWLLTGSATSINSLGGIHRVALTYANSAAATRTWLTTQQFAGVANQWTVTDCNTAATLATCYANQELLIVGRSASDADAPTITAAIKTAMKNGVPVLYMHPDWGTNLLSDGISGLLGFSMPYGGNWWDNDAASWTAVDVMYNQGMQGYAALTKLLTHFKKRDWNLNLTTCTNNSCSAADLQSEFYAGARDTLRSALNDMDTRAVDLFAMSGQRINKLLVLLGDVFRRDIRYPLDKLSSSQDSFLRAYYADHSVYYNRSKNPVQPDLGSFSKPIPTGVPLYSKDLTLTTRISDHFTAAGVYAVPGQAFTVTRSDTGTQPVKIYINSLRSGSTHEFDTNDYTRPKYLQSPWVTIKAGQTITLSSPHGGPIQVWLQGSSTPISVQLNFNQVGQHPVWNGAATTLAFKDGIAKADYDWVEFLTPGFQIHSTRAHMLETLADPMHTTPETLADVTWNYFYKSIFNLAGFTGQDLALNSTVAAMCMSKGWDCTNPQIHGMFGMWHFNADQAACGYGCSGNPYDAYWGFGALGWGDAHEVGHGLQRYRLKINDGASTEVSNNIFPTHTVYSWNQANPTNLQTLGHNSDQAAIFAMLNSAATTANPAATVNQSLWLNASADVFWRLEFYRQLAYQNSNSLQLGDGGWDIFTLMYLQDRLFDKALANDTTWAAEKTKLGFALYDRPTASAMNGNDFMLIATSFLTGKDQRPFFDLWGVSYSATASTQVASFKYPAAEKLFYVLPKTVSGDYWSSRNPIGSVLVDGITPFPFP